MPTELTDEKIAELENRIHYTFRDKSLLRTALTHSSAKTEGGECNERMEFLGDAVVGLTVSEYLYTRFPDVAEGTMSMMKSVLVSAKTLTVAAEELRLEGFILVGKGLARRKALPSSILCNALEALVAAMYLDGGGARVREMVLFLIRPALEEIIRDEHEKNYKSLLQDHAQKSTGGVPEYRVLRETGPDHKKQFEVEVVVDGTAYGPARGASKKEAEQEAARAALKKLGLIAEEV
jgi:ribonuclease-3